MEIDFTKRAEVRHQNINNDNKNRPVGEGWEPISRVATICYLQHPVFNKEYETSKEIEKYDPYTLREEAEGGWGVGGGTQETETACERDWMSTSKSPLLTYAKNKRNYA